MFVEFIPYVFWEMDIVNVKISSVFFPYRSLLCHGIRKQRRPPLLFFYFFEMNNFHLVPIISADFLLCTKKSDSYIVRYYLCLSMRLKSLFKAATGEMAKWLFTPVEKDQAEVMAEKEEICILLQVLT